MTTQPAAKRYFVRANEVDAYSPANHAGTVNRRTHLSLDKDVPDGRPIEPPELSAIIPIPEVGGLHHRYVRRAA